MARKAPYQDQWRNGKLVRKGRRECAGRYTVISGALRDELGDGPWSVADVGGWDGYFVRRLVEDFRGKGTLVEQRAADLKGTGIRHLQRRVTKRNVHEIGFHDAILILAVLHHMDDWLGVYEGLKKQCVMLVLELAVPDEAKVASRAIAGADRNTKPSYRYVLADDMVVLDNTPGPNGSPRPLVIVRCAAKGAVGPGTGQAAPLIAKADFSALGYTPFAGTLNIKVSRQTRAWFMAQEPAITIKSGRSNDRYIPASIDGVSGPVHVSFSRDKQSLEIIAPIRLRDQFSDGDIMVVRPCA